MFEKTLEKVLRLNKKWRLGLDEGSIRRIAKQHLVITPDFSVKAYHVEPIRGVEDFESVYGFILEKGGVVYAEEKYDGTCILVYRGLAKIKGSATLDPPFLLGLAYICEEKPDLYDELMNLSLDYVVFIELFGALNSPARYHLGYREPFDLVVFDLGDPDSGKLLTPREKYEVLRGRLPAPRYRELKSTGDFESLLTLVKSWVGKRGLPGVYEGFVLKSPARPEEIPSKRVFWNYYRRGLVISKVKVEYFAPQRPKKRRKKRPSLSPEFADEVENELNKMDLSSASPKDIPRIAGEVLERLRESHPDLLKGEEERLGEKEVFRCVARRVARRILGT